MTRPAATLITCLRDEGPFLIEWLSYHRAIGFDRFIIGANDCTDGSHEMLLRLAEIGEVIYLPFSRDPAGRGAQYQFANLLAAAGHVGPGDWVMWLDLDEFLLVHRGDGSVQTLIHDLGKADGIFVNWGLFGIPEGVAWPGRQLHPALCRCAPETYHHEDRGEHRINKVLFRFAEGMAFHHHGPVLSDTAVEAAWDWRDGSGGALRRRSWPRKRLKLRAGAPNYRTVRPAFGWAQVNHYAIRHPDFAEMRRQRGRGSHDVPLDSQSIGYADRANRYSDDYFRAYNLHSHHDPRILRHLPATDAQMARLLTDATLCQWHDHALRQLPPHAPVVPLP